MRGLFRIVWTRGSTLPVQAGSGDILIDWRLFTSLEQAKEARTLAGDLVVSNRTLLIVLDKSWLWDWELANPDTSYAHKMIEYQRRCNLRGMFMDALPSNHGPGWRGVRR